MWQQRCLDNFCSLCHRYFYGMIFSNARAEGLIITTSTTSQWNAGGPCLSFTENYLWSTLSLPCYLLPLLVEGMTSLLSEMAVICQGMMTIKSEEQSSICGGNAEPAIRDKVGGCSWDAVRWLLQCVYRQGVLIDHVRIHCWCAWEKNVLNSLPTRWLPEAIVLSPFK